MQSAHACAVQTHFFVFTFQWPKAPKKKPKSLPKWSLRAPKITKKQKKRTLKKTLKKGCNKYQKIFSKRTTFSWRRGLQNHKNPSLGSKYAPSLQKGFPSIQNTQKSSKKEPPASKITQNHENLVTQNQENPRKKTSRIQEIKMRHGGGKCAQRPG